jgi:predicted phosphodiesterase
MTGAAPTKLAVITDVHANLPALQAVLSVLEAEGYDVLYHTGDAIGIGPHPRETLDLLLATPRAHLVLGNHELRYLQGMPATRPDGVSELEFRHARWLQATLGPDYRPILARLPRQRGKVVHGLHLRFLHYAPGTGRWQLHPVVQKPSPTQLDEMFLEDAGDAVPDVIFYGHHHPPADQTGAVRYVNPGALGCTADGLARFVTLTVREDARYTLERRSAPYDVQPVLRALARQRVPARDFIYRTFFKVDPERFRALAGQP